jgi:hypothetical protein
VIVDEMCPTLFFFYSFACCETGLLQSVILLWTSMPIDVSSLFVNPLYLRSVPVHSANCVNTYNDM